MDFSPEPLEYSRFKKLLEPSSEVREDGTGWSVSSR